MTDQTAPTPRTDAEAFDNEEGAYDVVHAHFARQLERELAALSPPPAQDVALLASALERLPPTPEERQRAASKLRALSAALQKAEAKLDAILAPQAASVVEQLIRERDRACQQHEVAAGKLWKLEQSTKREAGGSVSVPTEAMLLAAQKVDYPAGNPIGTGAGTTGFPYYRTIYLAMQAAKESP